MKEKSIFENLVEGVASVLQTEQFCRVDELPGPPTFVSERKTPKNGNKTPKNNTFIPTDVVH